MKDEDEGESDIDILDRIWNMDSEKLSRMMNFMFKDDPMFRSYGAGYYGVGKKFAYIDWEEVEGAIAKMNEYEREKRKKREREER